MFQGTYTLRGGCGGFYIRPDKAFHEWWKSKGRHPIPPGQVIPVLVAIQGHPEELRLWEKHADAILRECGMTPTTHKPCLDSGLIHGQCVLFERQVDEFTVTVPSERIANILFDMIDNKLIFPLKHMGLVDLFNGIDAQQIRDWIKILVKTCVERIMDKHLKSRMNVKTVPDRPTPLPLKQSFMRDFLSADGDPDEKAQAGLAKDLGF